MVRGEELPAQRRLTTMNDALKELMAKYGFDPAMTAPNQAPVFPINADDVKPHGPGSYTTIVATPQNIPPPPPPRKKSVDALIDALAVCSLHGLDVVTEGTVVITSELPAERDLHEIAYAADITPAQLIRAWGAIVDHLKREVDAS
jgi:hypothetical protein